MTTNRFRHRTPEVEAVQWTGSNVEEMRAFCSPFDFETIDPADRLEDPDQTAAMRESEHGTWQGMACGDWAVKIDGRFVVGPAADFAARYEPVAVSVPPPTRADDRAAVLNAAAQHLYTALFPAVYDDMGQKAAEGVNRAVSELRRMADEAQPGPEAERPRCPHCQLPHDLEPGSGAVLACASIRASIADRDAASGPGRVADEETDAETEAHPPSHTWKVESPRRDNWASWGATYDERDWARERYEDAIEHAPGRPFRLVRATTTFTVEAEHTPDPQ